MTSLLPDTLVASHGGSRLRSTAATLVGAALVFAISAGRIMPVRVGIGIACLALFSALAVRRTSLAVMGGMVAVALIPVYWGPYIPHTKEGILPVFGVCIVLLPRASRELRRIRLVSIDWMLAVYVALRMIGSLANSSRGAGGALDAVLYVAFPYAVFRLIGLDPVFRRAAAVGIVAAGAALSVFTIREYGGAKNPFLNHFPSGYQHAYWVRIDFRFRHPRPEASFGHADALGLFLAFATVLAVALAWRERSTAKRVLLYASTLLCLLAIADTLERGPFIFLLVAFPVILVGEARQGNSRRTLAAVLAAAALLTATPVGAAAFRLRDASRAPSGSGLQASAQDRFDTIRAFTDSRYFSVLGHDQGDDPSLSVQQAIGISTGLGAIQNAFMFTYVVYGALAVAAFAAMTVPTARGAFNTRLDLLDRSWLTIVISSFVIFLSVSFASQFGHFFWIALGIGASALQPLRAPQD